MSLLTSKELFSDTGIPVAVDSVADRRKIQINLHRHEYYEMLYVRSGMLVNRFLRGDIVMKAGDLIILKPYVQHMLSVPKQLRPLLAYCCSFLPAVVDSGIHSLAEAGVSHPGNQHFFKPFLPLANEDVSVVQLKIVPHHRREFCERMERLKGLSRNSCGSESAQLRCEFLSLLAFLADAYEEGGKQHQEAQVNTQNLGSRYQSKLHKTLNYIHDHANKPLTLEDMAVMCGTSVTYFCNLFKRETGMTFIKYLSDLRLQNACELLRRTGQTVTEICYQVGFNDYSNFGRRFKKYTGVSAAHYRRQEATRR